jgi:hypothetical protein
LAITSGISYGNKFVAEFLPLPELVPRIAKACCGPSTIPITVPITNVTAKPIPNITSFGCAVIVFMTLTLSDIIVLMFKDTEYKRICCKKLFGERKIKVNCDTCRVLDHYVEL